MSSYHFLIFLTPSCHPKSQRAYKTWGQSHRRTQFWVRGPFGLLIHQLFIEGSCVSVSSAGKEAKNKIAKVPALMWADIKQDKYIKVKVCKKVLKIKPGKSERGQLQFYLKGPGKSSLE